PMLELRASAPIAGTELVSRFRSEVEIERQAEQVYRDPVICSEVKLLLFELVPRASHRDLVVCELDSVPVRALENIPVHILIRAWRRKAAPRAQLRRHDLHFTA